MRMEGIKLKKILSSFIICFFIISLGLTVSAEEISRNVEADYTPAEEVSPMATSATISPASQTIRGSQATAN